MARQFDTVDKRAALHLASYVVELEAEQPRPDLPVCKAWQREAGEAARILRAMANEQPRAACVNKRGELME